MKKQMISTTVISFVILLLSGGVYYYTHIRILFTVMVTFLTIFYHLGMRLAVGYSIDAKYHNHMDYTKKWFQEKPFEATLYKKLQVKKWKKFFPSFNPEDFQLKNNSIEEIIQMTCQAEVVHEIIIVFSFVPILFTIWFGSLEVFIITSCLSALFDSIFVIMQRFNRPRLMRLVKK